VADREGTRIVTPGTLTDAALLDDKRDSLLLALTMDGRRAGIAWLNLANGDLRALECNGDVLAMHFERLRPAEVLLPDGLRADPPEMHGAACKRLPDWQFDSRAGERLLAQHFGTLDLSAYLPDGRQGLPLGMAAAGALFQYAQATQRQTLAHVTRLAVEVEGEHLRLDAATRRNLEISETLRGEPAPTLLSLVDTCSTGMGSRWLRHCLHHPLAQRSIAAARHQAVAALLEDGNGTAPWRAFHSLARGFADIERITARIALKSARPRDLSTLRDSLAALDALRVPLGAAPEGLLASIRGDMATPVAALRLLQRAIRPEPSTLLREGGVIADGYDAALDDLRTLQDNCGEILLGIEVREKARTGIANLKVEFNKVHGFYIEVSNAQAAKVPDDYRRRQTLKNAERYITPELKTFEDKALSANERALSLEKQLYEALLSDLADYIADLQRIARAVALADGLCAFADTAQRLDYCRPQFQESPGITIEGGRHPVVEVQVEAQGGHSSPMTCACRQPGACCWLPVRTWAVNRPTCGRLR